MEKTRTRIKIYDNTEIRQTYNPILGSYYRRFNPYARLDPESVRVKVVLSREPTMHDICESSDLGDMTFGVRKEFSHLIGYETRFDGKRYQNPHLNPLWDIEFEPSVSLIGPVPTKDEDIIAIVLAKGLASSADRRTVLVYGRRDGRYIGHGHSLTEALAK